MGKIKLRKFLADSLHYAYSQGYGTHRKDIKGIHNETPYIHSSSTYKTYRSQCNHFCDWCYENNIKDPKAAKNAVPDYIEHLKTQGKSAWTIYTAISAISKAYGCSTKDFNVEVPKRERLAVRRSRQNAVRDKHFSEAHNQAVIDFCRSTGLRRRELEALHGTDLIEKDGKTYINIKNGKGGKSRQVEVINDVKLVKKMMANANTGLVFGKVHSAMDIHHYRSIYACDYYKLHARNIEDIPKQDRYICRKDKAGIVYDKVAMAITSQMLGHNRVEVIAKSYLYNL